MKALRIYLSSKSTRALKVKREEAQKLNDLRVFKKITAILAFCEQMSICEMTELLDVSAESVRLWIRDFLHCGMESFSRIKSKGRPSKLSKKQKSELEKIIQEGPQKAGYPGQC